MLHKLLVAGAVVVMLLMGTMGAFGSVKGAIQEVSVCANVMQRLVFSLSEGAEIDLVVDPISDPSAEAASTFEVKTNAANYAITASFGAFEVGDTGYDLIEHENFKIMSEAPGVGDAIYGWTTPGNETDILVGENGLTNGESTVVGYQLTVDFAVPSGAGTTMIVFTAMMTL